MILGRKFYQKNTLEIAQSLLGCVLVRKIGRKIIKAMITETEAYMGEDDLASHASKGRTPRTELMYGEAGHAYVYMYHCLNVVTEQKNFPAAVLIRAVHPVKSSLKRGLTSSEFNRVKIENVDHKKTNGPGKLCKFLEIDRKLNGWDVTAGEKLWIEKPDKKISKKLIKANKRIGIDYAKHCKEYLWRFTLLNTR
jgi:DNA-3-methyladenine glycosylase